MYCKTDDEITMITQSTVLDSYTLALIASRIKAGATGL